MDIPASLASTPQSTLLVGTAFATRAGAHVIDLIALSASSMAILFPVGIFIGLLSHPSAADLAMPPTATTQGINLLAGPVLATLYFTVFETLYGATPGKVLLGLRVVREGGERCDFQAAFVRALMRYVDGLFLGVPAYLTMQTPLYQRLGDKVARTLVVSRAQLKTQRVELRSVEWFAAAVGIYLALATVAIFFMLRVATS